jgi:hypothetical protein
MVLAEFVFLSPLEINLIIKLIMSSKITLLFIKYPQKVMKCVVPKHKETQGNLTSMLKPVYRCHDETAIDIP